MLSRRHESQPNTCYLNEFRNTTRLFGLHSLCLLTIVSTHSNLLTRSKNTRLARIYKEGGAYFHSFIIFKFGCKFPNDHVVS